MNMDFLNALLGGVLIGVAVTLMLWLNGRVTGISGIIAELLSTSGRRDAWRSAFLFGLLCGGFLLRLLNPGFFENTTDRGIGTILLAGLLVGFGTSMGSGCTSGHGVCGVSRLSMRSIVATMTFMAFGVASVWLFRTLIGGG